MRRIWAIALVSARNGIRSRGMLSLLALLVLLLPSMMLAIRDDGTTDGYLQLAVRYPSALVFGLLAVIAVWAGSAGIAEEIRSKTIHLIATKPVSALEMWLGKWAGLMILLVVLLGAGKGAGYLFIHARLVEWQMTDPAKSASALERLCARVAVSSHHPSARPILIKPGESHAWRFDEIRAATPVLSYQVHGASISQHRIAGEWFIHDANGIEIHRTNILNAAGRENRISFALTGNGDARDLIARFENRDPDGIPVYMAPGDEPQLLVPAASFRHNYLRSVLIDLSRLSLIAAIGISAGSLLSLPVAALVSFLLMIIIQLAPLLPSIVQQAGQPQHHHQADHTHHDHELDLLTRTSHSIVQGLAWITRPVYLPSGAGQVADGRMIPSTQLVRSVYHGLLLPLGIGVACAYLFRKRELALPER